MLTAEPGRPAFRVKTQSKLERETKMSIWDKVDDNDLAKAEGITRSPYMNEQGRYLIRITSHKVGVSQTDKHEIKFVPEFEVLQTAHGLHPVGCRRSDVVLIPTGDEEKCKTALGKVKAHLSAVLNIGQEKITKNSLKKLEENPLLFEGHLLWLDVLPAVKAKSGKDITPRQYIHIKKEDWAGILAEADRLNREKPVAPVAPDAPQASGSDAPVAEAESDW